MSSASSSAAMATKRRRVEAPVIRGVSIGAASRLRSHLQEHPEDMAFSQTMAALSHQERKQHSKLYSEWNVQLVDLKTQEGEVIRWAVPGMAAVLKWHLENNPIFEGALQRAARDASPLQVIVYCDEMVPGNPLHPEQRRKLCNWFVSILQFDQALSSEYNWLPIATLLSSKMKKLEGGCSQAHRVLMERALADELGLFNAGVVIESESGPVLVMFELLDPLADELGLKSIVNIKGSSGLKPCLKCVNVFMKGHALSNLAGNVDICCFDKAKFEEMTDDDLFDAHDMLAQLKPRLKKTAFGNKETAYGVNYSPEGVLASHMLRERTHPTKSRFDRMHTLESGGIAELEVNLLLQSLDESGKFTNKQVTDYCNAGWFGVLGPVQLAFRDNKIKGMASDVLRAMPILFHFGKVVLQGWDQLKLASFEALFLVFKQLQYIKFFADCSKAATDKLSDLVARHLRLFQQAYTPEKCIPKHHMAMHLGDQYYTDGHYADCFATERHQKLIKAVAEDYNNTKHQLHEFYVLSRANRAMKFEVSNLGANTVSKTVEFEGELQTC